MEGGRAERVLLVWFVALLALPACGGGGGGGGGAAPQDPSDLVAEPLPPDGIRLTWVDRSDDEDGFTVERGTAFEGPFEIVTDIEPNTTHFDDVRLGTGLVFYYRVLAHRGDARSAYTNVAEGRTPSPLDAPSGLTATPTSSATIDLAWTDESDGEDGFRIERNDGCSSGWNEIATTAADATGYQDQGLSPGSRYCYRVQAWRGTELSAYSETAEATTFTEATSPPSAPTDLVATAVSSRAVSLAWTDTSDDEQGFRIYRAGSCAGAWAEHADVPADTTTYSDTGLQPSTFYCYRVVAHNQAGASSSASASVTTQSGGDTSVAAPSDLLAVAVSSTSIGLTWTDNASNEDGVSILRGATCGSLEEVAQVGPDVTSHLDTGLSAGASYCYQVTAHAGTVVSAPSNTASASTESGRHTLSVLKSGGCTGTVSGGGIACGSTCSAEVDGGASVTLTATPDAGCSISGWSGCDTAVGDTCTVTVDGDHAVGATFAVALSTRVTITGITTPVDGAYTLSWSVSGIGSSSYVIDEAPDLTFGQPTSYSVNDGSTSYAFTGKTPGTYCYRVGLGGTPARSDPACTTVSTPQQGILRIVNASHYGIIDIRIGGQQQVQQGQMLPVGGEYSVVAPPGIYAVALGAGFWDGSQRNILFGLADQPGVTAGQTTTVTMYGPTIGELLTAYQPQRDYVGEYWADLMINFARFRFTRAGAWTLYDNDVAVGSGQLILVDWPDYGAFVHFKICPTCQTVVLPYPFSDFYMDNGPPDWPTIHYQGM